MSLERVRTQLGKFGLAKPNDEMAVAVQPILPYYLFSDSIGETFLIARADDVSQRLNEISYHMGRLTPEQFWSGSPLPWFRRTVGIPRRRTVHRQRIRAENDRKALHRSGKEAEQGFLAL